MTHSTLRLGSTGVEVKQWQQILGVTVDGSFGINTQLATKDWQSKHKLTPDGIVGPISWATALGEKVDSYPKTGSAVNDLWAWDVVQEIPDLNKAEKQYLLTVARGEGNYGLGWKPPGDHSNNWGAIQAPRPWPTHPDIGFPYTDHHADGSAYIGYYKKYSTPEAGARDMARTLFERQLIGPGQLITVPANRVRKALNRIDVGNKLRHTVFAQHDNGYFELDPERYYDSVLKNYRQLTSNVGWDPILDGGIIHRGLARLKLVS